MSGPTPDVAAARAAVRSVLEDLPPGSLVLVACSGGQDSVALAAAAAFVAPRIGLRAGAICIDHGLQAGSSAVADAAVATCRRLGLDPAWAEQVDVVGGGGLESAARDARYAALEAAAERTGAPAVLLGHTLDDQAETVLLGLARGSGARALAGMAAERGVFRRPFLGLRRVQTGDVCAALEIPVWSDPMNVDGSRRRAAVRHTAIPALEEALGPGVVPALARSGDLLRADADLLDALAADLLRSCVRHCAPERIELAVDVLADAAPALRGRALRAAALELGSPAGALAAVHVAALTALVLDWHGQGPLDLPGGVVASRRCGRLIMRAAATPR